MRGNVNNPIRFGLERWIQKGILGQMLIMAGLVALVAVAGGFVAWVSTPRFEHLPEAVWWAFLRLTDPGYLGDDEGAVLRTISTVVTVLGYVLFMGSLIAIMTQWLSRTLRRLESGLTPIAMAGHVVVLGWTNRTPELVLKLLGARGRLRRFLQRHDTRKLRVVVLSDDAGAERRAELRDHLGRQWSESQVFLRSGSSMQVDHLLRLDILRASVVLIPGADFELGGAEMTDTRVVKSLLTLQSLLGDRPSDQRPTIVAEVLDPLKVPIAQGTLERDLQIVASHRIISRLISQCVRHRGLAQVLFDLLSHREGNSIYLRSFPELAGHTPRALAPCFPRALVLGLLRGEGDEARIDLDPRSTETARPDDQLVLLAENYDDCEPQGRPTESEPERPPSEGRDAPASEPTLRILLLGWSHKITTLVSELDQSLVGDVELTTFSRMSIAEREQRLARVEHDRERIRTRHLEGDYAIRAELEALRPAEFDQVVLLASEWMDTSVEADARTILGYVLLTALLRAEPARPEVLVELVDPENSRLFPEGRDVVLVTPRILSHLLAHVGLLPELMAVIDELFCAGGVEFALRSAGALGLAGRDVTFDEVRRAGVARGVTSLGLICDGGTHLNPPRERTFSLSEDDQVVVLALADGRLA